MLSTALQIFTLPCMLYAICNSNANDGGSSGAVMAFDVPKEEFDELKTLHVERPSWNTMVFLCQSGRAHKAFFNHQLVKVVVGCVSHDPNDDHDPDKLCPHADRRIQFACRGNFGDVLHSDRDEVRVRDAT
jgi:hypothetical protein